MRAETQDMVDALSPPRTCYLVDPRGSIRRAALQTNINHPVVDEHGVVKLRAASEGWHRLDRLYEAEGPAGGMDVFLQSEAARARGDVVELPNAWLPPTVVLRRNQHEHREWQALPSPPLPKPEVTRGRKPSSSNKA
jgi:hypothetical protein